MDLRGWLTLLYRRSTRGFSPRGSRDFSARALVNFALSTLAPPIFSLARIRLGAALVALILLAGGSRTGYDYKRSTGPRYTGVHVGVAYA